MDEKVSDNLRALTLPDLVVTAECPEGDCQFVVIWAYGGRVWSENVSRFGGAYFRYMLEEDDFTEPWHQPDWESMESSPLFITKPGNGETP